MSRMISLNIYRSTLAEATVRSVPDNGSRAENEYTHDRPSVAGGPFSI